MITDTPELRRLLFVVQQRRARFVAMHVSVPTGENDEELEAEDERFNQARIALMWASSALFDYLQEMVDA